MNIFIIIIIFFNPFLIFTNKTVVSPLRWDFISFWCWIIVWWKRSDWIWTVGVPALPFLTKTNSFVEAFSCLHSLSKSPELPLHKWAKESRELQADWAQYTSSIAELQSLCRTSGRLVKNIPEMHTFIPLASYRCGLSLPKCCDVASVFPRGLRQSAHPSLMLYTYWTTLAKCSHSSSGL